MSKTFVIPCPKCKLPSVKFVIVVGAKPDDKNFQPTSTWYCVMCHTCYYVDKSGKLKEYECPFLVEMP